MAMTDKELRDAAVGHLTKTTTGYLKANGQPKPPPWPEGSAHWKAALDLLAEIGLEVPEPEPEPPATYPVAAPLVINAGGTYSGKNWTSTSSTPCITIETAEPVTIRDAAITNRAGGILIQAEGASGCRLTIERLRVLGGPDESTSNRWLKLWDFQSVAIRNCTIENTEGIQVSGGRAGSTFVLERCRHTNIQGHVYPPGPPGNFVQFRGMLNTQARIS